MKELILEAWVNRELLKDNKYSDAVRAVIEEVDKGRLRVASPSDPSTPQGGWQVNEWVKQAILLYFGIQQMQTVDAAKQQPIPYSIGYVETFFWYLYDKSDE